jgi:transcription-repair coupling factor (superfamily II helicase)
MIERADDRAVNELLQRLRGCVPYAELLRLVRAGERTVNLAGVSGPVGGLLVSALSRDAGRPVVAVVPDLESARDFHADAALFGGAHGTFLLPDRDLAPYEPGPVSPQLTGERLRSLAALPDLASGVVVTTAAALHEALPVPSRLAAFEIYLAIGDSIDREQFLHRLVASGYRRVDMVELGGDFSVRGAIVDMFCPAVGRPLRVELDGDAIASLRFFDSGTQRSLEDTGKIRIGAAAEALLTASERSALLDRLPDPLTRQGAQRTARLKDRLESGSSLEGEERYLPWLLSSPVRLPAYFPDRAFVAMVEPDRIRDASERLVARTASIYEDLVRAREPIPRPHELAATVEEVHSALSFRTVVEMRLFPAPVRGPALELKARPVRYGAGEFRSFLKDLGRWSAAGYTVLVGWEASEERDSITRRVADAMAEGATVHPVAFTPGRLSAGAEIAEAGMVLLPARDVLGAPLRKVAAGRAPKAFRDVFADLKLGEPVVHEDYGIGLYRGIVSIPIEDIRQDFFLLEYAESEKLYLPVDQVHRVQKYLGGGPAPRLSRLGTEAWEHTKSKVKASLRLFAEKLLKLYAERKMSPARPFPTQEEVENEIVRTFPYEETPDQERAIAEVMKDLAEPTPMDRLVCGDVGYGKTEVALRAAFRAAMQGSQVAVLVPTTVLAEQHYRNFVLRMADAPLKIEMLSRFRSPRERKRILDDVEKGRIDIVVGTHQLLAKSVRFKSLGLLVIDEEHRFGVGQKERLKELKRSVHVLTMTATPIPRTLNMGMTGLRDMSVIETPPPGRLAVLTHVLEDNPAVTREAILRELARGGQVFYLHNRVQSIAVCAQRLRDLVPSARLAVAHGQMPFRTLERAMTDFTSGKADVLVCTSIIGAGLDLPNSNTLIVERAELFGLADLYQLRGRVGRSRRQAYAYFFYSQRGAPTLDARRRLAAMLEFGELGSGFRLAVRDLEIRGAGNLLGPQQHGVLQAVGFDLYSRLLDSTVREIKGEVVAAEVPPQFTLAISAYLPDAYVADGRLKLEVYKKLAACETADDLDKFAAELRDRYGEPPPEVGYLMGLAALRRMGTPLGLARVARRGGQALLTFRDLNGLRRVLATGSRKGWKAEGTTLTVPVPTEPGAMLNELKSIIGGGQTASVPGGIPGGMPARYPIGKPAGKRP